MSVYRDSQHEIETLKQVIGKLSSGIEYTLANIEKEKTKRIRWRNFCRNAIIPTGIIFLIFMYIDVDGYFFGIGFWLVATIGAFWVNDSMGDATSQLLSQSLVDLRYNHIGVEWSEEGVDKRRYPKVTVNLSPSIFLDDEDATQH